MKDKTYAFKWCCLDKDINKPQCLKICEDEEKNLNMYSK